MKCLLVSIVFLTLLVGVQEADLQKQYDEKIDKEFAAKISWQRSLREAVKLAKEQKKPIFGYFTCSDKPSPPSARLEDGPFVADWFVALSERFVPYLHITSGLRDEPDPGLFARKGGRLKPFLIFMDPASSTLFEVKPFAGTMDTFETRFTRDAEDAATLVTARSRLAKKKSDKKARGRATVLEMIRKLRAADVREMRKAIKALKKRELEEDQPLVARAEKFLGLLPFYEVRDDFDRKIKDGRKNRNLGAMEVAEKAAGAPMYRLLRQGKSVEDPEEEIYFDYWKWATEGAIAAGDKPSAQKAYQALLRGSGARKSGAKLSELKKQIDEL